MNVKVAIEVCKDRIKWFSLLSDFSRAINMVTSKCNTIPKHFTNIGVWFFPNIGSGDMVLLSLRWLDGMARFVKCAHKIILKLFNMMRCNNCINLYICDLVIKLWGQHFEGGIIKGMFYNEICAVLWC